MTRLSYPNGPMHTLMQATARRYPDKPAIRFEDRVITFKQFDEESNRLAHGLSALGLAGGDRMGLFLPNCPEYELAFYAASKIGAVSTPLNPSSAARDIVYQLNSAGAAALMTHERLWAVVEPVRDQLQTVRSIVVVGNRPEGAPPGVRSFAEVIANQPVTPVSIEVQPDQLAALPFSSGTTGMPKGVMLTHRHLVTNQIQFATAEGISEKDTYIVYLPLSHIYGVALMGNAMYAGTQQIILERFDLATAMELISRHGVTIFHAVPPVLLALANSPDLDVASFKTLRYILCAAAPMPPDVGRRVEARLGVPDIQACGMTEAAPLTHHSPLDPAKRRIESVGVLVADTEQRVVDAEEGLTVLGPGEVGEIIIRAPQVMSGYWNAPEETANTIRNGWLHTGDIGYVDDDGYLFIVDRKKEMIKCKGFGIAPADLEGVVVQHPDVADCAVVGMPDPECGELPKAFVVAQQGRTIDLANLRQFIAERVAGYKQIRVFEVVNAIPRTPSGKILRRVLKQTAPAPSA